MDGSPSLVDSKSNKQVTIALDEIAQDKITYERTKKWHKIGGLHVKGKILLLE